MVSLLDVNVLISLLDSNHEHHQATLEWWNNNEETWASCPITQNGYLRIVTQSNYKNSININEAVQKLTQVVATPKHKFLNDDISLLDKQVVNHQNIRGHKHITDIYLLALAVKHGARFVTFDQKIQLICVYGATNASIHVIGN